MSAFHRELASQGTVNAGQSRLAVHDTTDADVFIAGLDAVLDHPGGQCEQVSLVQVFRIRDGRIAVLRDYFTLQTCTAGPASPRRQVMRRQPGHRSDRCAVVTHRNSQREREPPFCVAA